jgi:predicted secreted protein
MNSRKSVMTMSENQAGTPVNVQRTEPATTSSLSGPAPVAAAATPAPAVTTLTDDDYVKSRQTANGSMYG